MKNPHYEFLGRRMREYHRTHQWRLSDGGLYIPHVYGDMESETLSSWDDVGFILNGRRIIVWWKHPRRVYEDTISSMAWEEAGEGPKMIGSSRARSRATRWLTSRASGKGCAASLVAPLPRLKHNITPNCNKLKSGWPAMGLIWRYDPHGNGSVSTGRWVSPL